MGNWFKQLLHIKDRSVAKEMVETDRKNNPRKKTQTKRHDFSRAAHRRAKHIRPTTTKVLIKLQEALQQLFNVRNR